MHARTTLTHPSNAQPDQRKASGTLVVPKNPQWYLLTLNCYQRRWNHQQNKRSSPILATCSHMTGITSTAGGWNVTVCGPGGCPATPPWTTLSSKRVDGPDSTLPCKENHVIFTLYSREYLVWIPWLFTGFSRDFVSSIFRDNPVITHQLAPWGVLCILP